MERTEHSLGRLFDSIESLRFAALGNVASDEATFIDAITGSPEFQQLVKVIEDDPRSRGAVLNRLHELSAQEIDPRYEHPSDVSMATYVLAMFRTRPLIGHLGATSVRDARNVWWTRQIARSVNGSIRIKSNAAPVQSIGRAGVSAIATGAWNREYEPDTFRNVQVGMLSIGVEDAVRLVA